MNISTNLPETPEEYIEEFKKYFEEKYNFSVYTKMTDKQIEEEITKAKNIIKEHYNKECFIEYCYGVPSLKITKCFKI